MAWPDVQRKIYRADPIQEAICEVRFRGPTEGWAVLPGQLFDTLRSEYPAEPTQEALPVFQGGPMIAPGISVQPIAFQGVPGRVKLSDATGKRLVLISAQNLTLSSGRPYEGWEAFWSRIQKTLEAFYEIMNGLIDVERVGIRYVNKIEMNLADIEKYFDIRPLGFPGLPLAVENFISRSELKVDGEQDNLLIATFASTPSESSGSAFVLDLDAINQNLSGVTALDDVFTVILKLREIEKSAFEYALKDEARDALLGGYEVAENV